MDKEISINVNKILLHSEVDKVPKSELEPIVRQKISEIYEECFGKPLSDSKALLDVTRFATEFYPHFTDVKMIISVSIIQFFMFLIDDYLEENLNDYKHWVDIYQKKIEPKMDNPYEKFYKKCIDSVGLICTELQKRRYVECLTCYFKYYEIHIVAKAGKKTFNNEEYIRFRDKEGGVETALIFLEAMLGIELSGEIRGNDLMEELYKHYSELIIFSNEIFSYKKELAIEMPFNYVIIKSKNNNITHQEAMDSIIDEMNESYEKFLICKKKIIKSKLPVCKEFLEGVHKIAIGQFRWYLSNDRYGHYPISNQ